MASITPTGIADYDELIEDKSFYIDKTYFIKDWWDSKDKVTLITRPRRFGKTLTMSMLNCFFSVKYANRADLFQGKKIWEEEKYRQLQGTYPVIFLSFANVKDTNMKDFIFSISREIGQLYRTYRYILSEPCFTDKDRENFHSIDQDMDAQKAKTALNQLCEMLYQVYHKNTIMLLDEYDTPMTEAWLSGYWDEMVSFMRPFFNSTFKTNPYLERGLMTGVTRVSKESLFSDMNNLKVISTTSEKYADVFGFTQEEVDAVLDEYGKTDAEKQDVKRWYDGYCFGSVYNIYNPASIIGYLDEKKLKGYWVSTSSNTLIGDCIRLGDDDLKSDMETLMNGGTIVKNIDEELIYSDLGENENAVWSLFVASGFLSIISKDGEDCVLRLTNLEVTLEIKRLINRWFGKYQSVYNRFLQALCSGNIENMNIYLSKITEDTFGTFDVTGTEPERFYHGFVIGLLAAFWGRYHVSSNRESRIGRYDVLLKPLDKEQDDPIILEFKVDRRKRFSLKRTVAEAHKQIEEKNYAQILVGEGFDENRIRKYGIAFHEKKVLVG